MSFILAGRRVVRLGIVIALVLGCGSCGTVHGSTKAGAVETPNLRVGVMPILSDVSFFIALDTGMFKRAGLHVTPVPITGAEQGVPMMEQGKLDLTFGNWVSFIQDQADGTQIRIVAEASQAAPDNYIIAVPKGSPIHSADGLAGKTIGVNTVDNVATLLTNKSLEANNVPAGTVHYRQIPFPNMEDALRKGKVDAAFLPEPFLTTAEADLGVRKILDLATESTANFPIDGFGTTAAFAGKNPKTDAVFERVLQQAQAQANARTIPKILTDKFFNIPPVYSATVSTSVYPITLNLRRLQRVVDAMVEARLIPKSFNLAQMKAPGVQVS